jgi:hypothetical protein
VDECIEMDEVTLDDIFSELDSSVEVVVGNIIPEVDGSIEVVDNDVIAELIGWFEVVELIAELIAWVGVVVVWVMKSSSSFNIQVDEVTVDDIFSELDGSIEVVDDDMMGWVGIEVGDIISKFDGSEEDDLV